MKKRLQVRIVGQERDNAIILTWIDSGPNGTVSIKDRRRLKFYSYVSYAFLLSFLHTWTGWVNTPLEEKNHVEVMSWLFTWLMIIFAIGGWSCVQLIPYMYNVKARGGGGGVLGSSFAGYVPLASQNPYPIIVYFWSILWPIIYKPHLSHFWANDFLTLKVPKKCDPILVTLLKMLEKSTPL